MHNSPLLMNNRTFCLHPANQDPQEHVPTKRTPVAPAAHTICLVPLSNDRTHKSCVALQALHCVKKHAEQTAFLDSQPATRICTGGVAPVHLQQQQVMMH